MEKTNVEELRNKLLKDLPESLNEKLKDVKTDVEFCKILADNGIDVEKTTKRTAR